MTRVRDTTKPRPAPSPADEAAFKRRVARAVQHGLTLAQLRSRFGLGDDGIKRICAEMRVELQKPGSGRRWG